MGNPSHPYLFCQPCGRLNRADLMSFKRNLRRINYLK